MQHPTGGVVGEVRARDGDRVKAGDIVVRLDDTVTKVKPCDRHQGSRRTLARRARLLAEQDGADRITFPPELTIRRTSGCPVADGNEVKLFQARRIRPGQSERPAQGADRAAQARDRGAYAQERAKAGEIELIRKELVGVRSLFARNLVQVSRLTGLERDAARLDGDRAQFIAEKARSRARSPKSNFRSSRSTRISGARFRRSSARSTTRSANSSSARSPPRISFAVSKYDHRSMVSSLQSTVHTVGGVIAAGDTVMLIVPETDNLSVEAKINPQDIDQFRIGQKVLLRMSAFNQRTTPEISAMSAGSRPISRLINAPARAIIRSASRYRRMRSRDWATSGSFQACRSRHSYRPGSGPCCPISRSPCMISCTGRFAKNSAMRQCNAMGRRRSRILKLLGLGARPVRHGSVRLHRNPHRRSATGRGTEGQNLRHVSIGAASQARRAAGRHCRYRREKPRTLRSVALAAQSHRRHGFEALRTRRRDRRVRCHLLRTGPPIAQYRLRALSRPG